ncbi:MAG: ROK family protein [Prevotellaceae bacterium]|jgi:glucokinase|nr:ROK family protein [Prevotellaceae bacterium]
MYNTDDRIVLTLDAGGTNFVFLAIQGNKEIVSPLCLPAFPGNLDKCLQSLYNGFSEIKSRVTGTVAAISFAFPGPADYKNGIIGDLPNFPSFRGGVPLGPFLKEKFKTPVYINNDGNLFAYGEALVGALPQLNAILAAHGCKKTYKNLIGITFGTGFGSGVVIDSKLLTGDNDCGGDVWVFRNKLYPDMIVEDSVSIRAVIRVYNELSGNTDNSISPKDIFDIAEGVKHGDKQAAIGSFAQFGEVAGDAISHLLAFTDGIVVIGGGITGAAKYIFPSMLNEMRSKLGTFAGDLFPRLEMELFDLTDSAQLDEFVKDKSIEVKIPYTNNYITYNPVKQLGILVTNIGTSKAVALGAYAYALAELDK